MKRFVILATLVSICALAASPLKAEEPAKTETLTVAGPCGTIDCSRLPAPMAKAMRNMPSSMAKAMENFKVQDMKLPGSCEGGKCTFELPAGIIPPQATAPCKDGKC
jgi:hypothetical protein